MLPKIDTILYTTDLGTGAPYVFRYALSLAQFYEAKVTVVHAMEPLSSFAQRLVELHVSHENSVTMHQDARLKVKGDIVKRLDAFCEKEAADDPEGCRRISDILVDEGYPAQVILELAAKIQADMIVMGTHRHTVIGEALLGSTAHKVVHKSTIPVLLVRIPNDSRNGGR